jgi:hypothetical protein
LAHVIGRIVQIEELVAKDSLALNDDSRRTLSYSSFVWIGSRRWIFAVSLRRNKPLKPLVYMALELRDEILSCIQLPNKVRVQRSHLCRRVIPMGLHESRKVHGQVLSFSDEISAGRDGRRQTLFWVRKEDASKTLESILTHLDLRELFGDILLACSTVVCFGKSVVSLPLPMIFNSVSLIT